MFSISFLQTKKFADVIIPRGADNTGIIDSAHNFRAAVPHGC